MFTNYFNIEDKVRIFYKVFGSKNNSEKEISADQPTLLFLHGGPGVVDHSLYEPFWSQFADKEMMESTLQVIFIDHRGNGQSYYEKDGIRDYGDPTSWNLPQWGKDVHTFFTHFNINNPILAGVSFGGVVAMSCATQFPNELGGLILSDTDARFNLEEVLTHFANKVKSKGGNEEEINRVCNAAQRMFLETTPESYADYIRLCIPYCATNPYKPELISRCIKNEKVAFIYNRNELTKFNFIPLLSNITCPVLVMAGDQNPVHTAESAKRTAAAINPEKIYFKLFSGAGSPVYADRKDEVILLINKFLNNLSVDYTNEKNQLGEK